jgi:hypothetical protein
MGKIIDAYRAAHNAMARKGYGKHPANHAATVVASQATYTSTERLYYEPCEFSAEYSRLESHKKTKGHLKKTGESDHKVNVEPAHARAVKKNDQHGGPYGLACRTAYELGNPNKIKSHLRKMADIEVFESEVN